MQKPEAPKYLDRIIDALARQVPAPRGRVLRAYLTHAPGCGMFAARGGACTCKPIVSFAPPEGADVASAGRKGGRR